MSKVAVYYPVTADGSVWKPGVYVDPGPELLAMAECKREFNGQVVAAVITADINEEELVCPQCDFCAKSKAGLLAHIRKAHPSAEE